MGLQRPSDVGDRGVRRRHLQGQPRSPHTTQQRGTFRCTDAPQSSWACHGGGREWPSAVRFGAPSPRRSVGWCHRSGPGTRHARALEGDDTAKYRQQVERGSSSFTCISTYAIGASTGSCTSCGATGQQQGMSGHGHWLRARNNLFTEGTAQRSRSCCGWRAGGCYLEGEVEEERLRCSGPPGSSRGSVAVDEPGRLRREHVGGVAVRVGGVRVGRRPHRLPQPRPPALPGAHIQVITPARAEHREGLV